MRPVILSDLPSALPIFPLAGVLLLPGGRLPLNIFEPRYIAMVDDALKGDRLIGMIQPHGPCRDGGVPELYKTGCAGRIVSFNEMEENRYAIVLCGVSRFKVEGEIDGTHGYRCIAPDWNSYLGDLNIGGGIKLDRARLQFLLHSYFQLNKLSADWEAIEKTPDERLLTSLAMICPFDEPEKQALLEAATGEDRARVMMTLMEIQIATQQDCGKAH